MSHSFTPDTPSKLRAPALSLWSADLSLPQRVLLSSVVVAMHGLVWWLVMRWPVQPLTFSKPTVITAQLVSERPLSRIDSVPMPLERPPAQKESKMSSPTREQLLPRRQAIENSPSVLSSLKTPQVNEPSVPIAENRAVPVSPVVTAPAAVRATKDVGSDMPATSERTRHESNEHTISPADYLIKPPNDYPSDAYDAGESGTVKFEVLIDESGRPEDFKIARSSGSPRLDRQARRNVMRARFKPRTENGQPWKGWLHGQMTFTAPD